ncbi:hypothetical protein RRG08_021199 [Elysia crispata]|uniref:Uncharacterized protein n=1 Tax=Elysia crispata TaxID=231223 RepID=A0AAE0YPT5_9GAST|nr:hypothetical protein RRG08_021199 [Elysia crispata]
MRGVGGEGEDLVYFFSAHSGPLYMTGLVEWFLIAWIQISPLVLQSASREGDSGRITTTTCDVLYVIQYRTLFSHTPFPSSSLYSNDSYRIQSLNNMPAEGISELYL